MSDPKSGRPPLATTLSEARAFVADFAGTAGTRAVVAFAFVLAGAALEAVALLALAPVLDLASGDGRSGSGLIGWISSSFDRFGAPGGIGWSVAVALVFGAAMIGRAALALARDVRLAEIESDFLATKLTDLVALIGRAPWSAVSALRHSRVTHVFTTDIHRVVQAGVDVVGVAVSLVTIGVQFALALAVSPLLTLVASALVALSAAAAAPMFRAARSLGEYATATQLGLLHDTAQFLAAMKLAISQNLQHRFVADFSRDLRGIARAEVDYVERTARIRLRLAVLSSVAAAVTIVVGVGLLAVPLPELVLVVVLLSRMNGPAQKLQTSALALVRALPAYRHLVALRRDLDPPPGPADAGPIADAWPIRFAAVTYRHARDGGAGVNRLDLEIGAGDFLGIAGRSGAGKTTFADLLVGLYAPQGGEIRAGGRPLDLSRSSAWRDRIGYVSQDPFLRNDTVRANLLWAAPDAGEADMARALALSGADRVVEGMAQGLDTVVGERGSLVSGGERQRIAIARALLRRPRLLILDEATNAIDIAGEHDLLTALRSLLGETTIVMIAHRAESLALCDRIAILRDGAVTAEGSYDALRPLLIALDHGDPNP